MKKMMIFFALITFISGCTSGAPDECQTANWYNIGYQDGLDGNDPSSINSYIENCAEAGITPDRDEWKEGFDKGRIQYCLPDNGYTVGIEGKAYYGVCRNKTFLENYQSGHQEYQRILRTQEAETKELGINQ